MYTLDQVLKPDFSRTWQEAVALVQEVANALGGLSTLPAPEDVFLEDDATVAIGFASEEPGDPVTSLATMLLQLLEGTDAPASLRSLAIDNAKTPPAQATTEGFTRALAFYERPDRQSDVRAVVARLSARRAALTAEEELERLRNRMASPPEEQSEDVLTEEKKASPKGLSLSRFSRIPLRFLLRFPLRLPSRLPVRESAIAAVILIALLGTLAVAGLARGRSGRPAAAVTAAEPSASSPLVTPTSAEAEPIREHSARRTSAKGRPAAAPQKPVGASLQKAVGGSSQKSVGASPQKRVPPVQGQATLSTARSTVPPAVRIPAQPDVQNRRSQMSPLPLLPVASVPPSLRGSVPTATKGVKPPVSTDSGAAALEAPAKPIVGHIYSAAEPTVTPARLTRSQLPREPAATAETGYFDLIVDEKGDVEFVKLLSPTHRYYDRILVAAAKAWKFTPARLNGSPVKYRLLIPIILSDIAR